MIISTVFLLAFLRKKKEQNNKIASQHELERFLFLSSRYNIKWEKKYVIWAAWNFCSYYYYYYYNFNYRHNLSSI